MDNPLADFVQPLGYYEGFAPDFYDTSQYGDERDGGKRMHLGVDGLYLREREGNEFLPEYSRRHFMRSDVTPIYCIGRGTIYSAGWYHDRFSVVVDHHLVPGIGPLCSFYTHFKSLRVTKGDEVDAGDILGIGGKTGTNLNHLHFELWLTARGKSREGSQESGWGKDGWAVDPVPYLQRMMIIDPRTGARKRWTGKLAELPPPVYRSDREATSDRLSLPEGEGGYTGYPRGESALLHADFSGIVSGPI